MSDFDFGEIIFDIVGDALGLGVIEKTIGKAVLEGLKQEAETETKAQLKKKIQDSITNKKPVKLTPEEIPMLRRVTNRAVGILSFGKLENILEGK